MASDLVTASRPPLVSDARAAGTPSRLLGERRRDVHDVAAARVSISGSPSARRGRTLPG